MSNRNNMTKQPSPSFIRDLAALLRKRSHAAASSIRSIAHMFLYQ